MIATKAKVGRNGTAYYKSAFDYNTSGHVTAEYVYPTQTTSRTAADRVTTSYAYTYWNTTTNRAIKTRTVTQTAVPTAQNGSNVASVSKTYYDEYGNQRWQMDSNGVVTYYGYHPITLARTLTVRDVNTASLPAVVTTATDNIAAWSGSVPFTRSSVLPTALNITSKSEYDELGYLVCQVENDGTSHYYVKGLNKSMTFPAWNTATSKPTLPINVTETDALGKPKSVYQLAPTAVTVNGGKPTGVSSSTKLTWTKYTYNARSGNLEYVDRYHTVPTTGDGTLGTNYYRTASIHDPLGRTVASIQYVAANKWQVHAVRFDWQGRAIENLSGVTTTLPTQYSNIYSNNAFAAYLKTTAKSEYDASGKLLRSLRYHGTGANDFTGVRYHYDTYNRTRAAVAFSMTGSTETPFGPYQVTDYDWLDRAVASAMFEAAPTWSSVVTNDTYAASTTTSRRGLSKNYYDKLGRLYKSEVHQVAATGAASNPAMTNFYYDAAGRQVASQQQNGLGSETAYDAVGRAYQTRSVKALATTKYTSGRFVYLNPQPKPALSSMTGGAAGVLTVSHSEYDTAGSTIRQYTLDANPNQSTGISISSNNFVRRSVFSWYDIAGRLTTQADYGSGASTWIYAAAPARPATAPTASGASCLVTRMLYNATNGRLETVIDPKAVQHKTFTDALGRTLFTVRNFTTFASLAAPGNTASDKDVVTGYAYNGLGQLESLTAVNPTTGNQVTKYLYEDPVDASLETSAIYPDSADTTSSGTDQVKTTYHLDGLVATRTDQNGTVHTYAYDAQRRETADQVTTLAASIDGTVRKITRSYNWFGALEILSSIDNNNTVLNQLRFEYDNNQNLKKLYQSPDGAVNVSSTPYLEYTYSTTIMGRLLSAKYPSGKTLTYNYDTNGRVTSIQEGTQTIVSYNLTGSGNMLQTQYTVPGLSLDYASGQLDRFQRIIDHAWKKNNVNMVQIKHDYDYNGNRLNRLDTLNTTGSELYAYDGINQINSFKRGTLNAARTAIASPTHTETWNHDKTGNWTSFASGGTTQNRTHSKANEIATLGGSSTNVGADKNGNMTKITKPSSATSNYALTYDAWNRIVQVKDGSTTVATYNYNGLNHRVKKTVGSTVTKSSFNENWQELESVTGSETLVYVWGQRYVDDLVYRQRGTEKIYSMADSNWNVVALSDASGSILERFRYDAFGRAAICDGGFVTKTESAYTWTRTFTGQVLDPETGLMLYRNRYYHTTLGRFVSRDPIGYEADDMNLYRYVGNQCITSPDPLGLFITPGGTLERLPPPNWPPPPGSEPKPSKPRHCAALEKKIESYLDTEEEKRMWRHYVNGGGTSLDLSKDMDSIIEAAKLNLGGSSPCSEGDSWSKSGSSAPSTGSPWSAGLGVATFNYTASCDNGCFKWSVSLNDYYDFDPKPKGTRSKDAERKTRLVNMASKLGCGWKPYSVTGSASGESGCCD